MTVRRRKKPQPPVPPSLSAAEEENAFRKRVLDQLEGRGGVDGSRLQSMENLLTRLDERTSLFEKYFATKEDLAKHKLQILVTAISFIIFVVLNFIARLWPQVLGFFSTTK